MASRRSIHAEGGIARVDPATVTHSYSCGDARCNGIGPCIKDSLAWEKFRALIHSSDTEFGQELVTAMGASEDRRQKVMQAVVWQKVCGFKTSDVVAQQA